MDEDAPVGEEHKLKFGVEAILAMETSKKDEQAQQRDFDSVARTQIFTFIPPPPMSNVVCWPLSLRNRARRGMLRRAVFTEEQRQGLELAFLQHRYISKPDRKKLAQHLTLQDSQVKIWFQNRRMKWRNNNERPKE